jgi:hypothetical protein
MEKKWAKKETRYLNMLLKVTTKKKVDDWLRKNPPPPEWEAGRYAWAYTEMIIL